MHLYQIETFQKEVSVSDYKKRFVDIPKFTAYCRQCPNYKKNWACPPFNFSPETLWDNYRTLLLCAKKLILPEALTEQTYDKNTLKTLSSQILTPIKQGLLSELTALESRTPDSLVLSMGRCDVCITCSRLNKQPCRCPERCRHSIESLGGDVNKTIETYFNEKLQWPKEGQLPEHFFLMGGLLKK